MINQLLFFSMPGGLEMVLILLVVVLLFGAKRIPKLMKGLGAGIKEFKEGIKEGESGAEVKKSDEKIDGK